MGMGTEYREFTSFAGYDQFFQEVKETGDPAVDMYVPTKIGGKRKLITRTYVGHSERDFKIVDFIFNDPRFKGRWKIAPVPNLQAYRDNTDNHTYRVALRKLLIPLYRKFMNEDKLFMPLSVFGLEEEFWISGRHRSEGGKDYGAIYSVVMWDLTESEILYIIDITNEWHQETWDENERALVALGYAMYGHPLLGKMNEKQALAHMKLNPEDRAPLLGAMLYKWHNQGPNDRRLIETAVAGAGGKGGRPRDLKTLGEAVKVFGEDSIKAFPLERWLHYFDPDAAVKDARRVGREGTRHPLRSVLKDGTSSFTGADPNEKWKSFLSLEKEVRVAQRVAQSGASGPTDGRIWMNFVFKYLSTSHAGLIKAKRELTTKEREQSAEVVAKLNTIFGT